MPPCDPSYSDAVMTSYLEGEPRLNMSPGDLLVFNTSGGQLAEIGAMQGVMGHVLLVVSPARLILRLSFEAQDLIQKSVWPAGDVNELWLVSTLESTRQERGLHGADSFLYEDPQSGHIIFLGTINDGGSLYLVETEVDLWQSPPELRSHLRFDLMSEALKDMKKNESDWSAVTAVRAFLTRSSKIDDMPTAQQTMQRVRDCWRQQPICTSVAIIFWQRYLCLLAANTVSGSMHEVAAEAQLILKWMPLKADCALPGDLLSVLQRVGWVSRAQVREIARPLVHTGPAQARIVITKVPIPHMDVGCCFSDDW